MQQSIRPVFEILLCYRCFGGMFFSSQLKLPPKYPLTVGSKEFSNLLEKVERSKRRDSKGRMLSKDSLREI